MTHSAPDPRAIALDLIAAVLEDGRFLDQARDTHPDLARLSARDRAFAQLLATTVLRHMGRIDAVLAGMVKMPKGRARHILRLGAAQILFLATPAHAAVATSVDLAHKTEVHRLKGLVNAVLRRLTNEGALLLSKTDPLDDIPGWLMDIWRKDWGMALAQAIAAAQLAEAPLDITVKSNPEDWAARLDAGILPTGTLRRSAGGDIRDLPGFAEGAWWIQDAASAIPAKLLAPGKNQHIVDLCAAPGGKTAQMATAGASVTAVDVSEQRLTRLRANLDRLHLSANIVQADATKWQPKSKADGVLIDAPCSATGAIRRHPDLLRLKKNAQIRALTETQDRLLDNAARMSKPGGVLVYCTCSLQRAEGEGRIMAFLDRHPDFRRDPVLPEEIGGLHQGITKSGEVRILPNMLADRGGMDGFFMARLKATDA